MPSDTQELPGDNQARFFWFPPETEVKRCSLLQLNYVKVLQMKEKLIVAINSFPILYDIT